MNEIIRQAAKNFQRHFIVWGTLAVFIMFAGIQENQNGTTDWDRAPANGTYEQVITDNVCKDTIKGKFPTAAIVYNIHTGGYEYITKSYEIGLALDEALGGKDWHGYTPRHFCK